MHDALPLQSRSGLVALRTSTLEQEMHFKDHSVNLVRASLATRIAATCNAASNYCSVLRTGHSSSDRSVSAVAERPLTT